MGKIKTFLGLECIRWSVMATFNLLSHTKNRNVATAALGVNGNVVRVLDYGEVETFLGGLGDKLEFITRLYPVIFAPGLKHNRQKAVSLVPEYEFGCCHIHESSFDVQA